MRWNRATPATAAPAALGAAVALLLPLALGACSSGDSGSPMSGSPERASVPDVQLKLVAYKPSKLTVDAGETVTWRQSDPGSHTVTSGTVEQGAGGVTAAPDGTFSSGELTTGETFEFEPTEPGTYPYFCEVHPATMRGQITVR